MRNNKVVFFIISMSILFSETSLITCNIDLIILQKDLITAIILIAYQFRILFLQIHHYKCIQIHLLDRCIYHFLSMFVLYSHRCLKSGNKVVFFINSISLLYFQISLMTLIICLKVLHIHLVPVMF